MLLIAGTSCPDTMHATSTFEQATNLFKLYIKPIVVFGGFALSSAIGYKLWQWYNPSLESYIKSTGPESGSDTIARLIKEHYGRDSEYNFEAVKLENNQYEVIVRINGATLFSKAYTIDQKLMNAILGFVNKERRKSNKAQINIKDILESNTEL